MLDKILLSVGSFILIISVALSIAIIVQGEEPAPETETAEQPVQDDSLEVEPVSLDSLLSRREQTIDSLNKKIDLGDMTIANLTQQIEKLRETIGDMERQAMETKELAKTFDAMKTDEMRPILKQLDDVTAMSIYRNMNGRSRKKFMLALSSIRAANITKKIAQLNR